VPGTSVGVEAVKRVSGKSFKITEAERREGDAPVLTSDASKVKKELGWKPELPELERMVETAWKWHNEFPDGYPD
jgi:UDP-glucose 4-epimerase